MRASRHTRLQTLPNLSIACCRHALELRPWGAARHEIRKNGQRAPLPQERAHSRGRLLADAAELRIGGQVSGLEGFASPLRLLGLELGDPLLLASATGTIGWYRTLIQHNSAAILNADAKVLGGVTEWMKVAALAQVHDLDVAPHGSQDIHIHLVSAIANGLILEYYRDSVDPMWGKMYQNLLRVNPDGTVSLPEVPGHGAEPNYAALEPFRVVRDRVAVPA